MQPLTSLLGCNKYLKNYSSHIILLIESLYLFENIFNIIKALPLYIHPQKYYNFLTTSFYYTYLIFTISVPCTALIAGISLISIFIFS